jgi:peroxiredoxin
MGALPLGLVIGLLVGVLPQAGGAGPGCIPASPKEAHAALLQEYDAVLQEFNQSYGAAIDAQERGRLLSTLDDQTKGLALRAMGLARDHPGDLAAIEALAWIVQKDFDPAVTRQAIDVIIRDHLKSERLAEICWYAGNTTGPSSLASERLLREAMTGGSRPAVRGLSCFSLAGLLESRAELVRRITRDQKERDAYRRLYGSEVLRELASRDADDLASESAGLYERCIRHYPDLVTPRDTPLGATAAGRLFRLRNLSPGKQSPEIDGRDVDGDRFKLSEFRGKVVLLTFSGNWCPSCVAFYSEERRLGERFKDRPFATLGVNTDEDKATLRESIESSEITWRTWWDGGGRGPITLGWGIWYFPSFFVLDHKGVIRYTDKDFSESGSDGLYKALDTLLSEVEATMRKGTHRENDRSSSQP